MSLPDVIVLPVSGQALTYQMGIYLALVENGYKPKISMGASGGALIGVNAIINNFQPKLWIAQITEYVNCGPTDIVQKYMLGYFQSLMEPSIYLRGVGFERYLCLLSSGNYQSLRKNEIIINCYNTSLGQTELFTTACCETSVLSKLSGPLPMMGVSNSIHYLGNLPDEQYGRRLRDVLAGTSCVPVIFPPVPIAPVGNVEPVSGACPQVCKVSEYIDGGSSMSSPLTALTALISIPDVLYVQGSDIDQPLCLEHGGVITNAMTYEMQISRSNALQDRYLYLYSLCCGNFKLLMVTQGEAGVDCMQNLNLALEKTQGKPRMVELYPLDIENVQVTVNQSPSDYLNSVMSARNKFGFRIHYVDKWICNA